MAGFIAQEVAGFVVNQVDKIGKITVRLEERDYTQILIPKDGWQEERTTMSSLRLDSVISAVFNISRQRSKQLIESGKVKVNWTETTRPDFAFRLIRYCFDTGIWAPSNSRIRRKTKKEKFRVLLGVLRK